MSTPPHRNTALAVAISIFSVSACSDAPIPPPIIWEGEHLRFGTDADTTDLCAGTLPYLDGITGYLGEVFGRPRQPVDYYWVPDGTEPFCISGGQGCSTEQGVFSRFTIHQHELVHGVRFPRTMALPLEEGLAEAYGDDWVPSYGRLEGDIRSVLSEPSQHFPGTGYGRAGHFMSYLLAAYGPEAVLTLERTTRYEGTSFSRIERAFEDAFEQDLDTIIAGYEADYPRCDLRTYRDKTFDCSRHVVSAPVVVDERLEHIVSMRCDDPAVVGPRFGHRWRTVSLEITESSRYHIVVGPYPYESPALELMQIRRCDLSCFDYGDDILSLTTGYGFNVSYCLDPGRYLFRFAIDEDVDGEYKLQVTRTENGPSCD